MVNYKKGAKRLALVFSILPGIFLFLIALAPGQPVGLWSTPEPYITFDEAFYWGIISFFLVWAIYFVSFFIISGFKKPLIDRQKQT